MKTTQPKSLYVVASQIIFPNHTPVVLETSILDIMIPHEMEEKCVTVTAGIS